jgi:hypothetical protein
MREPSSHPCRGGNGWMHFFDDYTPAEIVRVAPLRQSEPRPEVATADHRHKIFTALLGALSLRPQHRDDLRRRGLSDPEIARLGFASTPSFDEAAEIVARLDPLGLSGTPGFYTDRGRWRMVGTFPGYFVPYRDTNRRISGLQYRLEKPFGKMKYVWLSSKEDRDGNARENGTGSGSPVHFARPDLLDGADEVLLTEGGLKASVICYLTGSPVIGVAGVSTFGDDFAANLKQRFPRLLRVLIAYDSDLWRKPEVARALERLAAQLTRARFSVRVRTWSDRFKGFDDYLVAQLHRLEGAA